MKFEAASLSTLFNKIFSELDSFLIINLAKLPSSFDICLKKA